MQGTVLSRVQQYISCYSHMSLITDLGQFGQVIECVLFHPGVKSSGSGGDADEPKEDVEPEHQILDAATDFRPILTPGSGRGHCFYRRCRRRCGQRHGPMMVMMVVMSESGGGGRR